MSAGRGGLLRGAKKVGELSVDDLMLLLRGEIGNIVEEKLNDRFTKFEEDLNKTFCEIEEHFSKVDSSIQKLEDRMAVMEAGRMDLENSCLKGKIDNNILQQRNRLQSGRINNMEVDKETLMNPDLLRAHVYDVLFQPILSKAFAKGEIDRIPLHEELIETIHPLPPREPKPTPVGAAPEPAPLPQIIFRIMSRYWKSKIFDFKRDFFTEYNKNKKTEVYITDDKTPAFQKCLNRLRNIDLVNSEKVMLRGTTIRFKMKGKDTWSYVKNPFGENLAEMLKKFES